MNSKVTGEGAVVVVVKKMSESQTKDGNQKKCENLKIWKFENLNSKIKMA